MAEGEAATISDVAAAAGVSVTTVSHALNGKGRVSEDTLARIRAAADELGYVANVHARGLATGRAATLAVQVAGFGSEVFVPDSSYFTTLLNGACVAAARLDYAVVLIPSAARLDRSRFAVDGALVVDPDGTPELAGGLAVPVVSTGRDPAAATDTGFWVDNDHAAAARAALDHLRSAGYQRPGLLTTARESYSLDAQIAYGGWAEEHGIESVLGIIDGPFDADRAAAETARMLELADPPDSIYATNDTGALGAMRAVRAAGRRVPDDVGIVAEMDAEPLRLADPPITAIDVRPREIGERAIELLIELVESGAARVPRLRIDTELVARASSAGPG